MVIKSSRQTETQPNKSPLKVKASGNFYNILCVEKTASQQDIRKSYYKLALKYHPDRIPSGCDEDSKKEIEIRFKSIGFAYEVLSNPEKREIYDTNPLLFSEGTSDITKFTQMFTKITTQDIDDFKKHYIGSAEELEDIMESYLKHFGNIVKITEEVFFGSVHEEERYLEIIKRQISQEILPDYLSGGKSPDSHRKKVLRLKKAEKEAKEADTYAKELGLTNSKNGSNLTALIQNKQKSRFDDMINNLENKYGKTPGSPSMKRNRSESDFDIQHATTKSASKRVKSNFPAKK